MTAGNERRRRRRRKNLIEASINIQETEILNRNNQDLANNSKLNIEEQEESKLAESINKNDFSHLFYEKDINLDNYPEIQDMLAAYREEKQDNFQDFLSYGAYEIPYFLPKGDTGDAYAFYEKRDDNQIQYFEKDDETGEYIETVSDYVTRIYLEQFFTYVVCKDIFPAFDKLLTRHGWNQSFFDVDWAINSLSG
ncbi:MAG: hypothetical protein AAF063_25885 [Cyanobacteria bacterium J06643_5]